MRLKRYTVLLALAAGLAVPTTASAQSQFAAPTPTPTATPTLPPVASLPRGTRPRSATPMASVVTRTSKRGTNYVEVAFGPITHPVSDCTMRGFVERSYGCTIDFTDRDPDWCQHNFAPSPVSINVKRVGTDAWQTYSEADQCLPPYDPSAPIMAAVIPPEANGFTLWDTTFMASEDGIFEYTTYLDNALAKQGWIKVSNSNPTGRTIKQYVNGKYNDEFFNRCYDGDTTIHSLNHGEFYCYVTDDPDQHIELLDSLPVPPVPAAVAPKPADPTLSRVRCDNKLVGTPRKCSLRAGRVKLSKLAWRTWGKTAKATGKVRFDGGTARTATITLSQPKAGTYTKITIKMAHRKTRRMAL